MNWLARTIATVQLRHLVATFNGNRHVRATLLDARDQPVAASELFVPTQPVPGWFRHLIAGDLGAVRIPILPARDGGAAIVLQADPENEIGEVWGESRDAVLVLGGLRAAERAADLRRRRTGAAAAREPVDRVRADRQGRLLRQRCRRQGPPELMRLANGFNDMTRAACHGGGAEPPAERATADLAGGGARRSRAGPAR